MSPTATELLCVDQPPPTSLDVLPPSLAVLAREVLETARTVEQQRIALPENEGQPSIAVATASPKVGKSGTEGVVVVFTAVRHEPAETRFQHLERLARIGVLSTSLAHELRNALVAVKTFTDILAEQQSSDDFVETVTRELDRANIIAEQMLNYSRPSPAEKDAVSIHEILERVLWLTQSKFKEAGADPSTRFEAESDTVFGDPGQLEQVFLNLVLNAIDSLNIDKRVSIETRLVQPEGQPQPNIQITIVDTGTGVSPEHLPQLFQPFFTTKKQGTGLGLYLAQRIMREHAGGIKVDSAEGQGTTVQVTLPVHRRSS